MTLRTEWIITMFQIKVSRIPKHHARNRNTRLHAVETGGRWVKKRYNKLQPDTTWKWLSRDAAWARLQCSRKFIQRFIWWICVPCRHRRDRLGLQAACVQTVPIGTGQYHGTTVPIYPALLSLYRCVHASAWPVATPLLRPMRANSSVMSTAYCACYINFTRPHSRATWFL